MIIYSGINQFAKQSYTAVDVTALGLVPAFYVEATMLWHVQQVHDDITTAVALQIFAYGCATQGKDKLAAQLFKEGHLMAERLNFFNVEQSTTVKTSFDAMPAEWRRATGHTAWSVYNLLS